MELVDVVVMSRPPADPGHLGEWLPEFARDLDAITRPAVNLNHARNVNDVDVTIGCGIDRLLNLFGT